MSIMNTHFRHRAPVIQIKGYVRRIIDAYDRSLLLSCLFGGLIQGLHRIDSGSSRAESTRIL